MSKIMCIQRKYYENADITYVERMAENYGRNDCDIDKFVEYLKVIRGNIIVDV
jgi:hypothetical protein